MNIFHSDVWILILDYLECKTLGKLLTLNKYFLNLIKEALWESQRLRLYRQSNIRYVIRNFKFCNYDFHGSLITNNMMRDLKHVRKLNLSKCLGISDRGLMYLKNIEELNIDECTGIKGHRFGYLTKLQTLDMSDCPILEEYVKFLKNLTNL